MPSREEPISLGTIVVIVFGSIVVIGVVVWGILEQIELHQKSKPAYSDKSIALDRASVPGFTLTPQGRLTAFFRLTFRVDPKKYTRKYKNVRVSVSKDKKKLADETLADFSDVSVIEANPVALDVGLKKGLAQQVRKEREMGYVDLMVSMTATLNGDYLTVQCENVVVNITSPANFHVVSCSVSLYRRLNVP